MSKVRRCEVCFNKLTQHETRACTRCKCRVERANWLHGTAMEMDKYLMTTTGNTTLDATIARYR